MTHINWGGENPEKSVKVLKQGLEAAFAEENIELEVPDVYLGVEGFYDHNIKVNKLSHRAITHFDLPIIHSWFKYGQIVPENQLRPKELEVGQATTDNKVVSGAGLENPPTRQEIKGFFIEEDVKDIMDMPLYDFLKQNYEEFAPPKYTELYLANLDVLDVFEEIREEDHLEESAGEYHDALKDPSMDVIYQVRQNPLFSAEIEDHVATGLRSIRNALKRLDELKNPTANQIKTVRESRRLYHEDIWVWPAFSISVEESTGPEPDIKSYRDAGKEHLKEVSSTVPGQLDSYREKLIELDLLPDSNTYKKDEASQKSARMLEKAALAPK